MINQNSYGVRGIVRIGVSKEIKNNEDYIAKGLCSSLWINKHLAQSLDWASFVELSVSLLMNRGCMPKINRVI